MRLGSQATWEWRLGEKAAGCLAEEKCISSLLACLFLSAPDRLSPGAALAALLLRLFLAVLPWPFLAVPPLLLCALWPAGWALPLLRCWPRCGASACATWGCLGTQTSPHTGRTGTASHLCASGCACWGSPCGRRRRGRGCICTASRPCGCTSGTWGCLPWGSHGSTGRSGRASRSPSAGSSCAPSAGPRCGTPARTCCIGAASHPCASGCAPSGSPSSGACHSTRTAQTAPSRASSCGSAGLPRTSTWSCTFCTQGGCRRGGTASCAAPDSSPADRWRHRGRTQSCYQACISFACESKMNSLWGKSSRICCRQRGRDCIACAPPAYRLHQNFSHIWNKHSACPSHQCGWESYPLSPFRRTEWGWQSAAWCRYTGFVAAMQKCSLWPWFPSSSPSAVFLLCWQTSSSSSFFSWGSSNCFLESSAHQRFLVCCQWISLHSLCSHAMTDPQRNLPRVHQNHLPTQFPWPHPDHHAQDQHHLFRPRRLSEMAQSYRLSTRSDQRPRAHGSKRPVTVWSRCPCPCRPRCPWPVGNMEVEGAETALV